MTTTTRYGVRITNAKRTFRMMPSFKTLAQARQCAAEARISRPHESARAVKLVTTETETEEETTPTVAGEGQRLMELFRIK